MSDLTPNLGLYVSGTSEEDLAQRFVDWRLRLCGQGNNSNMEILDRLYGDMQGRMNEISDRMDEINDIMRDQVTLAITNINGLTPDERGSLTLNARDVFAKPIDWFPEFSEIKDGEKTVVEIMANNIASVADNIPLATMDNNGLMSAEDKKFLASIDLTIMSMVNATLLWYNMSPESQFGEDGDGGKPVELPIKTTEFDFIAIRHRFGHTSGAKGVRTSFAKTGDVMVIDGFYGEFGRIGTRGCTIEENRIIFEKAWYNKEVNNDFMIPLEIYGIKIPVADATAEKD